MADTGMRTQASTTAAPSARAAQAYEQPTGWVGWNVFAATMLIIGGVLQMIDGFVAVVNDKWVVWGNSTHLYIDLTTWGWVHMGIGLVVLLAGLGVLTGNVLARFIGTLVAGLSLISAFLFLPAYPLWGITVMTLDVLCIWALTAHGGEMRARRPQEEIDLRP